MSGSRVVIGADIECVSWPVCTPQKSTHRRDFLFRRWRFCETEIPRKTFFWDLFSSLDLVWGFFSSRENGLLFRYLQCGCLNGERHITFLNSDREIRNVWCPGEGRVFPTTARQFTRCMYTAYIPDAWAGWQQEGPV